ncbi:MAG: Nudix family hydrolase [Cycloclasticus sp.]|nr:Nudix family hydrolase [Cycloclasticus sp.]
MLNVAVGVIKNSKGEVLISQRDESAHQGGLWEFPGGKLEKGETVEQALKRELYEELGIEVLSSTPLINIEHYYNDLFVHLNVHLIDIFQGEARGLERQPIKWVAISNLNKFSFPDANQAIINQLMLPDFYPIIDECLGDEAMMLTHLDKLIEQGYTMIQLRAKSLASPAFKALAKQAVDKAKRTNVRLYLNTTLAVGIELQADGVHLSAHELNNIDQPLPNNISIATSCHNGAELKKAKDMGVLFATLSPVQKTKTHHEAKPLGWQILGQLVDEVLPMPIYALGGLNKQDLDRAKLNGARGVAGIRGF